MRKLTSTSFLLLAFLSLRRWSAYELAEQVARGWSDYWPRSASGIYEEPKKLVAHGLATATRERTGARVATVYKATRAGRRALRAWVAKPSSPPRLECEAILRVAFADHAGKDVLLEQIRSVASFAHERAIKYREQGAGYLEDGGPFPQRMHLNLLIGRFLAEHYAGLMRWALWAQQEVEQWTGTGDVTVATDVRSGLRETVAMFHNTAVLAEPDGRATLPSDTG